MIVDLIVILHTMDNLDPIQTQFQAIVTDQHVALLQKYFFKNICN
jgi:hypothetical protein